MGKTSFILLTALLFASGTLKTIEWAFDSFRIFAWSLVHGSSCFCIELLNITAIAFLKLYKFAIPAKFKRLSRLSSQLWHSSKLSKWMVLLKHHILLSHTGCLCISYHFSCLLIQLSSLPFTDSLCLEFFQFLFFFFPPRGILCSQNIKIVLE